MKQPIFLEPVFKERIWGGDRLHRLFGYHIPSEQTGECWAISAHSNGESIVKSGRFEGKSLSYLWEHHQELFGNRTEAKFPLLTKILDAKNDLSVQVHPDDHYASKVENGEPGKTECWYVIDCEPGAEIIIGHQAKTKQKFVEMIETGQWNKLLSRLKVQKGDFFYVPSGTIHAIGAGVLILETQQSSDITYRVYDYDRVDPDGRTRKLHLDKAIEVSNIPHPDNATAPLVNVYEGASIVTFVRANYFSVYKWEIQTSLSYEVTEDFLICSVIEGCGELKTGAGTYPFQKGDHFLLSNQIGRVEVEGKITVIVSHP
ncbi:mannose-6-phosphate isomerase, class I [Anaerobacillus alkalidiazotrophicus]|uniref:mannose-6-phosphate isomerase, class I n=1 Tax=Anaerobacillus alkalidiazotrophicus TaxID=472963 RepID=UPI000AD38E5A